MKRTRGFRPLAALLAFLPITWVLPISYAQDLVIDPDDVEEIDSTEFGDDDEADDYDPALDDLPLATGLIIPNDLLDPALADQLSDVLLLEMDNLATVYVESNDLLRGEFEIMGAELAMECAFDPVCLGRVGWDIGLDRVIIGRVSSANPDGTIQFTVDLVDTESRSVLRYRVAQSDNNLSGMSEVIAEQLPYLFDIRRERETRGDGPTGPSDLQIGASWTSLGLGVTSLVIGIVFGSEAGSLEDEVRTGELREGGNIFVMTQAQAQAKLDEASDNALLANVFLGVGVALIGVSVLLFSITPGSDIDVAAEGIVSAPSGAPQFSPRVTTDGLGFEALITW